MADAISSVKLHIVTFVGMQEAGQRVSVIGISLVKNHRRNT